MSSLELARQACEDAEAVERAIMDQLDEKPRTTKQRVWQQHHVNNLISCLIEKNQRSREFFKDEDGAVKEELDVLKGADAFGSFYNALKETKDFHMRYNITPQSAMALESEMACTAEFSGEEMFGKYLDLHTFHERSLNMKQQFPPAEGASSATSGSHVEYVDYLETFHELAKVPHRAKKSGRGAYAKYVRDLEAYLLSFFRRSQPLVYDFDADLAACVSAFEDTWANGGVASWQSSSSSSSSSSGAADAKRPVDMKNIHSAADLEALGLDRLKEGLSALGLKCGGSLRDRAERLFSVKGLDPSAYPRKVLATGTKRKREGHGGGNVVGGGGAGSLDGGGGGGDGAASNRKEEKCGDRDVARSEAVVAWMVEEQLADVVAATKRHIEKRQTMLVEERDAEIEEEDTGAMAAAAAAGGLDDEEEEEDDDDDGPLYNPLNLPLGWDGKPIPYWLYKLHGLGEEFKCEICGNATYYGRRAFDKHFQEWQHAYGMRCLGIPNTKHFHDITLIEDAQTLYSKLKGTLEREQFNAGVDEEYEDSEGHVLNRRTYEDLARQGLL